MGVLMPIAMRTTSGGDKHLVLRGPVKACSKFDKDCRRVRIKVEFSSNLHSHPHCLFGTDIDLPSVYHPEASQRLAIRVYPVDVDQWDSWPPIYLEPQAHFRLYEHGDGGSLHIARLCEPLGKLLSGETLPVNLGPDERCVWSDEACRRDINSCI